MLRIDRRRVKASVAILILAIKAAKSGRSLLTSSASVMSIFNNPDIALGQEGW